MDSPSKTYGWKEALGAWKWNLVSPFGLTQDSELPNKTSLPSSEGYLETKRCEGPAWYALFRIGNAEFGLGQK
ncbi:hypothetical protein M413DRAFT_190849 [Hebeloma cylindrosporum]|uniref:Uncharacterized protein n=1 Tax=Hebeloma cylindrosporum TaxID=76867 RepID=A0A0C3BRT6_HEBCY|nr:hypothetical protein M413DRAFT_190849 [Hebeloma cylindrosporum h7]